MSGRSANGRSSIYSGADGRWHGRVTMGVRQDGRTDRRHVTGATEKIVTAKVRDLERQRDSGSVASPGKVPTVEQWLTHWLDTIAARKVRPSTLEGYRSKVRATIVPAIGGHRLDRLLPEHVERFYVDAEAGGLAPASVLQCHRILSRALKVAVQRGRIARNVCTLVDAPSLDRVEVQPLTAAEARRILAAAEGQHNAARWSVALALGLRQGEALGLAWDDVDLDQGTLRVRQALQRQPWRHGCSRLGDDDLNPCGRKRGGNCPERTGGGLVFVPPKSRAGRRTIALPDELLDALRAHRTEQKRDRLAHGGQWADTGLVFVQPDGKALDASSDRRAWKALLRRADVREARLHDARHTAATLLLQLGVPARVAMQVLGHSQISLTLGTYSHVVPELATEAASRMGGALWGPTETTTETTGRRRRTE